MRTFTALTIACACVTAQADLLAIRFNGTVVRINETTAATTFVGNSGVAGTNSLANSGGLYYTAANGVLYRIKSSTGAATAVSTLHFAGASDIRAMAADGAGRLWMIAENASGDQLWRVDPFSGAGTLIGNTGLTAVQSLECDDKGRLWAYDSAIGGIGLLRIHRTLGTAWDADPSVPRQQGFQSLAFATDGTLFGATNEQLFTLAPNGSATLVGGALGEVRGIESNTNFRFNAVPESFTIVRGRLDRGSLASLIENDGDALRVCKFIVPNAQTPPVQIDVTSTAPAPQLTAYDFAVRAKSVVAGAFRMQMAAFNYPNGRFVQFADEPVQSSYAEKGFTITTLPTDYVGPNREVKVRLLVRAVGPVASIVWCVDFDEAYWLLDPFFP
jgi:hypothetical protein